MVPARFFSPTLVLALSAFAVTRPYQAEAVVSLGADDCVQVFDDTADYFPQERWLAGPAGDVGGRISISFSQMFTVSYFRTFKVVRLDRQLGRYGEYFPNSSLVGKNVPPMVLWQCGTPRPSAAAAGVPEDASFFQVPLRNVALPWSGSLHMLELLKVMASVKVIDMKYVTSPCAQLLEVCSPSLHADSGNQTAWEAATASADAVFTDLQGTGATLTSKDVPFAVSADPGLLHRAEWIKFLALFFNKEARANEIFNRISADYQSMKAQVAEIKRVFTSTGGRPPTVAWAFCSGCSDVVCNGVASGEWREKANGDWCQCGSTCTFYNQQYRKELIADAGARPLQMPATAAAGCSFVPEADGSNTYRCDGAVARDEVASLLAATDVLVDDSYVPNHGAYGMQDHLANFGPAAAQAPYFRAEAVFRPDGVVSVGRAGSGVRGTAWYEQLLVEPQQLLSDLSSAVWGDSYSWACKRVYLRRLRKNTSEPQEVRGHTQCLNFDANQQTCAAVFSLDQAIPMCAARDGVTATNDSQKNLALGLGLGLGLGVPLCLAVFAVAWWFLRLHRIHLRARTAAAEGGTGSAVVVGIPVNGAASPEQGQPWQPNAKVAA